MYVCVCIQIASLMANFRIQFGGLFEVRRRTFLVSSRDTQKKTEKVETIDIEVGQTSPFLEVRRTYTDVMSDYEEEQTTPLRDLVWQDRLLRPSTLLL